MSLLEKVKAGVGIALITSLFAGVANDIFNGEEKKNFCDLMESDLAELLDESQLIDLLKTLEATGSVSISLHYEAANEEFSQFPLTGSHICYPPTTTLDLG